MRDADTPELAERDLAKWMREAMTDTGFCAREILGYNYDEDWRTKQRINIGSGGVRDAEPFRKMYRAVQGLDGHESNFMLLAPRGSLKSSIIKADAVRFLFEDYNRGFLFMSGTDPQIADKSIDVRNVFEQSEKIHRAWGLDPGESNKRGKRRIRGTPWRSNAWTLGVRDVLRDIPSCRTGSLRSIPTGGHYDRIYLDDLIDWRNCRNATQLDMAKMVLRLVMPLTNPGARVIVAGTRYHPADTYSHIETLSGWDVMVLPCGFEIEKTEQGKYRLHGVPMFPHLTLEYLQNKLDTMDYVEFCSQYMNEHVTSFMSVFKREHFRCIRWEDWMCEELTVWILTDTATSTKPESCLTALLAVGLDRMNRIYLLDARVGRMEGHEIITNLFDLHVTWARKAVMGGVTMEDVTANQMLASFLEQEQRRRGIRLNVRTVKRTGNMAAKDRRISNMEPRFREGDVHVVTDTFPANFQLDGKPKLLFDPHGHVDAKTGERLPAGELVDQFILHPFTPPERKDIADALSDICHTRRDGQPLCYWRRPTVSFTPQHGAWRSGTGSHVGGPPGRSDWLGRRANGSDWLSNLGRAPNR